MLSSHVMHYYLHTHILGRHLVLAFRLNDAANHRKHNRTDTSKKHRRCRMYVCMYVCMWYVCMHACMYTNICMWWCRIYIWHFWEPSVSKRNVKSSFSFKSRVYAKLDQLPFIIAKQNSDNNNSNNNNNNNINNNNNNNNNILMNAVRNHNDNDCRWMYEFKCENAEKRGIEDRYM
jgi:hypothetical protein